MKKLLRFLGSRNLYAVATAIGALIGAALSAIHRVAPEKTKDILPLGGDDLVQVAVVTLPLLALAGVYDSFRSR